MKNENLRVAHNRGPAVLAITLVFVGLALIVLLSRQVWGGALAGAVVIVLVLMHVVKAATVLGALCTFFPRLTARLHRRKASSDDMQHCPARHMGFMSKKPIVYEVALKDKKQIAEGTHLFVFEKPAGFDFNAGQHVRMSLIRPPETDADGNKRFLTIASTPQEPDLVFAMRMRDTAFKRVLNCTQPGERVLIEILPECPHGSFVLHEDASKPAVFIVGGIGIVPAYSMIKDAIQRKLPHKMFLFYSNRRPEDAPFLAELQNLAEQNPTFKLTATMTKSEKSAQTWQGEIGFINRPMLEKYVDDLRAPIYYVAGLPELVNAMQAVLAEVGVGKNNIRAEEFAGFKMGRDQESSHSRGKNHLLIAAIVLTAIVLIALHVGAGISMYHVGLGIFSLHSPIALPLIGLLLAFVVVKVFAMLKLKRFSRSKQGEACHKNS